MLQKMLDDFINATGLHPIFMHGLSGWHCEIFDKELDDIKAASMGSYPTLLEAFTAAVAKLPKRYRNKL